MSDRSKSDRRIFSAAEMANRIAEKALEGYGGAFAARDKLKPATVEKKAAHRPDKARNAK
jgi:hypothetical protein